MVEVSIVGASGYGGGELVRLLAGHPGVHLVQVVSDTYKGQCLGAAFPGLYGTKAGALVCSGKDAAVIGDAVFLAQESGYAMRVAEGLLADGKRVIDLSADFRLRDPDAYRAFYKSEPPPPHAMERAIYGLPELSRVGLADALLVANPGCYVTATTLALVPLLRAGLALRDGIVVDAKSGVSGAGRSKGDLGLRFSEANESLKAYGIGGTHRHTPEIEQNLGTRILFTPHLVPMTRGILATCYARVVAGTTVSDLQGVLESAYADEPFVVVRPSGDWPSTKDVLGSNRCHVAVALDGRTGTAVVVSVIDNLVKGAAGQAVQNFNIMFGFPETAGLEAGGQWP